MTNVKEAETLGETEFSKLFHEARTSSSQTFNGVSVPVKVNEGEIVDIGNVVKTRKGEHFHVRDSCWDNVISLPVRPFMETKVAKPHINRQIKEILRHY
jgi:hypothetical protein